MTSAKIDVCLFKLIGYDIESNNKFDHVIAIADSDDVRVAWLNAAKYAMSQPGFALSSIEFLSFATYIGSE